MKFGIDLCLDCNAKTFLLYKQMLDGTIFLVVARVRGSTNARLLNNAHPRFDFVLRVFSFIETLAKAAIRVHQTKRISPFSNLI